MYDIFNNIFNNIFRFYNLFFFFKKKIKIFFLNLNIKKNILSKIKNYIKLIYNKYK
ncbi:hypothetical protein [Candidatus Carsonella ruddii]|uniref:Uncharacterized protein n=1 Tax=Candidatus Carsonella ruddii CE isolate Thao2000 TaxID=1202536 RepID=J7GS14_CARRU|nr:hypothetical protein [Candidatus Carsonella ruddii]AFP83507.1 hypothetical protein A33U_033 [Candidatus Carsonella ruddii CE isolate Thao2000]